MKAGHFSPDIQEFLRILAQYEAKYLIVGGEAVIYYGHARLTGDLDIFFERSPENVLKLYQGLQDFWGGTVPGIERPEELLPEGRVVQFGVPPNRIDLINSIDGVDFASAWRNRVIEHVVMKKKRIEIYFIGLKQLIQNKQTVGRPQDLADLEFLRKIEPPL